MPCCLLSALMGLPRLALLSLLLLSAYVQEAFDATGLNHLLILVGLLFLPWTTLWFSWAVHNGGGQLETWHWVVLVLALMSDLGSSKKSTSQHQDY